MQHSLAPFIIMSVHNSDVSPGRRPALPIILHAIHTQCGSNARMLHQASQFGRRQMCNWSLLTLTTSFDQSWPFCAGLGGGIGAHITTLQLPCLCIKWVQGLCHVCAWNECM